MASGAALVKGLFAMSTSKLQRYTSEQLYKRFGKYGLVENTRPDWLISSKGERLELDFFIDKLSIAVEVQGKQHVEFTPVFHATEYNFAEQLRRDGEKKAICDQAGVNLLYIYHRPDIEIVLYKIHAQVQERLNVQDIWPERDIQSTRVSPQPDLWHRKRYAKRLRKLTIVEQQAYFDEVICRLERSLEATTDIIPSEASRRKTRRKIELATYCIDNGYVSASEEQNDIISRAIDSYTGQRIHTTFLRIVPSQ